MRLGFFAYPWDLLDEGVEATVETMSRCGCNAVLLNTNYHHARLLRPRSPGPKTLQLPGAVAAFEPRPEHYGAGGLMPVSDPRLAGSGVLTKAREVCRAQNIDLGLWTVALHNSTLGQNHPGVCLRNCFGDVYTYALCPAAAEVQAYARGLVQDLCTQFRPQRILVEAIGYLGLRHWVHHELFFAVWSAPLELLFSLCFCPACLERARSAGIDGERLGGQAADWAVRLLDEEQGDPSPDLTQSEVASLLGEITDLGPYLHLRSQTVTGMTRDLHAIARAEGVILEVIPASFHRPVSRAWLEGASLVDMGQASDGLLVPAYFDDASEVRADLQRASSAAPGSPISAGLNACSPALRSPEALAAQAGACEATGCHAIYYYNYGLLTHRRLDWVAQANAAVAGAGDR
jgi:hypothetical protein